MSVKDEILEAAYELFASKGYEQVSVQAICKASGSSKGGFYHHFASKEALVEELLIGYMDELGTQFEQMLDKDDLDIIGAFSEVFEIINTYKKSQMTKWIKIQNMLTFDGNHLIIRKMAEQFDRMAADVYRRLIEQGQAKGLFHVTYVKPLADLITREMIQLYSRISTLILEGGEENQQRFLEAASFMDQFINQQLGLVNERVAIKEKMMAYVAYAQSNEDVMKVREKHQEVSK